MVPVNVIISSWSLKSVAVALLPEIPRIATVRAPTPAAISLVLSEDFISMTTGVATPSNSLVKLVRISVSAAEWQPDISSLKTWDFSLDVLNPLSMDLLTYPSVSDYNIHIVHNLPYILIPL